MYLELVPPGAKSCMIMSGWCVMNFMKVHMTNTSIASTNPQHTSNTVCRIISNGVPFFTNMLLMLSPISKVYQITLVINAHLSDKCKFMFTTNTYGSQGSTGRGTDWPEIKHDDQSSNLFININRQLITKFMLAVLKT